jgi:hypothetical protein
MKSVLQDWVMNLGLRHQGVLVNATRGCDDAPKNDPSKMLTRCYRAVILNAHVGDPRKSASYIEWTGADILEERFENFRRNLDHYPHHYVMHLIHAIEIVGYKHPDLAVSAQWERFYLKLCKGLHVNPETDEQLDARLNADEETFKRLDKE